MEARILRTFEEDVTAPDGQRFIARVAGRRGAQGRWEAWIEFWPREGGPVLRSGRETVQSSVHNVELWARGLRLVYLEGSLERALARRGVLPARSGAVEPPERPWFDGPAPDFGHVARPAPDDVAFNPFLEYRRGEAPLRGAVARLSTGELRAIALAYHLDEDALLDVPSLDRGSLVELIVASARNRDR